MNTSIRSVPMQGISKRAFILFMLVWVTFLAVQQGDNFDESEHAHAAWLMGCAGKRPYRDFFQHHNPLTWDLLKIYYILGGAGPSVLYYGRALVLISALAAAYGFAVLSTRWSSRSGVPAFGNISGVLTIALFSCLFPRLFVVRPEVIGLFFFIGSLILWNRSAGYSGAAHHHATLITDFLSGIFFGAALYSSPVFILLAGAFVLFPFDNRRLIDFNSTRAIYLLLGTAVFIIAYTALMGYSFANLYFNILFTSILKKVGAGYYGLVHKLLAAGALITSVLMWLFVITPAEAKKRFLLHVVYFAALVVCSYLSGSPFLYIQVFLAPIIWLALLLTYSAARVDSRGHRSIVIIPGSLLVLCLVFLIASIAVNAKNRSTIVDFVNFKKKLLTLVNPSDKVLLRAALHPLCVEDASFYGIPIVDYENRLCIAVHEVGRKWRSDLPECNYLRDITTQRPALLDFMMVYILPRSDRPEFITILNRDYYPCEYFKDIGILKNR